MTRERLLRTRYLKLDDALGGFLESGCALIVGAALSDGEPYATRAWGLEVVDAEGGEVRLLVDADDVPRLAGIMAVTGADVRTLRSVQLKGLVLRSDPVTGTDLDRTAAYCDAFFAAVEDTDGTPRRLMDKLRPAVLAAIHLRVDELFDQTPGPSAGGVLVT